MNHIRTEHHPFFALFLALALAMSAPVAAAEAPDEEAASATTSEEESFENTLRWTTASEVDNFGYDVYRSESEEGPFDRLTEQPIKGAGTTDDRSDYVFVDDTIDPTKDYFYYVESISLGGERERFTPIYKAKAKLPADDEGEADGGGEDEAGAKAGV